jgi:hypothetical protein
MATRRTAVKDAADGAVLAGPVTSASGLVLLPEGTRLTLPLIRRLARTGVTEVTIVSGDDADAEGRAQLLDLLEERFQGHEQDEIMQEVKRIAALHIAGA